ncbi:hypothetical protein ACJ5NV_17670 [Loktanella agnita]|uniref:hypothetical protein n=1 Tax=Loktanella agnita TaxID=287097 RepID=UPI003988C010
MRELVPILRLSSFALSFLFLPFAVVGQEVDSEITLMSNDGTISIVGEYVDFETDAYVISTALGLLRLSSDYVTCTGQACPARGVIPTQSTFEMGFQDGKIIILGEEKWPIDDLFSNISFPGLSQGATMFGVVVEDEEILLAAASVFSELEATINSPVLSSSYLGDPVVDSMLSSGFFPLSVPTSNPDTPIVLVQVTEDDDGESDLLHARLKVIAETSARQLFLEALDYSCDFPILPETISPSVTSSFSVLGTSAEYTFLATFNLDEVCAFLALDQP